MPAVYPYAYVIALNLLCSALGLVLLFGIFQVDPKAFIYVYIPRVL